MRNSRLKLAAVAMMAGAGLLLPACSSADAKTEAAESPLSSYLEAMYSEEDFSQETYDEQFKVEQEKIAACMTKQGFEYKPEVQPAGISTSSEEFTEDDGPQWGTKEFAEQYGYGIITSPWMVEEPVDMEEPVDEYFDPNAEYLESLSPSEQEAYYEALWGPSPTEEEYAQMEKNESFEWNPENQGCWGEASAETINDSPIGIWEDPEFADLFESMGMLYEQVEQDSRLANLNSDWTACMTEAGYPGFTDRYEAENAMWDEWNNFMSDQNMDVDADQEWSEPSKQQKDEFQKREIAMAVTDFECRDGLKIDETYTEVQNEYEQKFIDENKTQLDAMLAKANEMKNS